MKKSLLALLALSAFAGAASAQVVIFGKLDQAVGKTIGSANKEVLDTAGSRIAFRGAEDLGGGLTALFALEHRLSPDTGSLGGSVAPVAVSGARFWEGFSWVGLRSATLGTVTLGRQYTSSFLTVQSIVDPFAGETIAKLRDIGMATTPSYPAFRIQAGIPAAVPAATAAAIAAARENPGKVRTENSVKYVNTFGPVSVSGDIAEKATGGVETNRPYSVSATFAGGPLWAGISYENPEGRYDNLVNVGASYKFGMIKLSGGIANGKRNDDKKVKGLLLGANITVGTGDIKVGYATLKSDTTEVNKRVGLGYHHNLSKRTKLFVDVAHDSRAATEKSGYDLGIQHAF